MVSETPIGSRVFHCICMLVASLRWYLCVRRHDISRFDLDDLERQHSRESDAAEILWLNMNVAVSNKAHVYLLCLIHS